MLTALRFSMSSVHLTTKQGTLSPSAFFSHAFLFLSLSPPSAVLMRECNPYDDESEEDRINKTEQAKKEEEHTHCTTIHRANVRQQGEEKGYSGFLEEKKEKSTVMWRRVGQAAMMRRSSKPETREEATT